MSFKVMCGKSSSNFSSQFIEALRARAALVVGFVFLVAVPWMFVTTSKVGEWHECFLPAARLMQAGESIAANSSNYTYPPAMAFFTIVFDIDSLAVSRFLWSLINVGALFAIFFSCWQLVGGRNVSKLADDWSAVFVIALLTSARWVVAPLEHLQYDTVIAGFLAVGCLAVTKGRDVIGGSLIGIAASMKMTPMLFLPYLMWRGRWTAAACLTIFAIGVNFLPDFLFPQSNGHSYCIDWYRKYLTATLEGTAGSWHTAVHLNQSLAGFFNRMAGIWTTGSTQNLSLVSFNDSTRAVVKLLNYGTAAILLGSTLVVGGRPFRGPSEISIQKPDDRGDVRPNIIWALEFGMLTCLMILLSPMSGKAHYVVLVMPTLVAVRFSVNRPTVGTRLMIGALLVTGALTCKEFMGPKLGDELLVWGLPTLYPIILLATMWGLHVRLRCDHSRVTAR